MPLSIEELLAVQDPEEFHRRVLGLGMLVEITRELASKIDIDQVLLTIAREACRVLDCERASLFQYDEDRRELYTRVVSELEIEEIRHSITRGVTGFVAREHAIANVPDPRVDPRWDSSVDRVTGFHTRNILATPILSGRRLLGVLELINKRGRAFDEFDERLLEALSQHASAALDRARLVEELQDRQALLTSLNVAREIQRGFMPESLPRPKGYSVATWWFPNEAVGGDYCDVASLRDGRLGLIIADVSGHGLGPALLMASVRASLRTLMLAHADPAHLLTQLALSLAPDLRDGRFITMVLGAIDLERHTLDFSNAGHAPALRYRPGDQSIRHLSATGLPLGVLEEITYQDGETLDLEVGDVVVFCTDGIVEAMNAEDQQFGLRRLEAIIAINAHLPIDELVREIGRQVEAYYVGDNPPDDLTVLAARRDA